MTDDSLPTEYTPRALLVVFGAFTSLFCTVGFLNTSGVFIEYYGREQLSTSSSSTIAWLGAVSIFFLYALSPATGAVLDAFGPKAMVYTGSIGLVFSIMMISLCHSFWQFLLAQGVLLGISMALATWPMIALVGQYFKRSRAAATGFVVAGSSLGGIVWPIMIDRLLNTTSIGFPWTMRIIGFTMIPLLIFSCVAAKSPEPVVIQQKDPEAPETSSDTQPSTTEKDPKHDRNAERNALYMQPSMQLTCLTMFVTYFGVFAPIFYLPSFATEQGFSTTLAFYTASIVNGASFVGRIIPGFVADKYGKFNCCIVAMFSTGIVILCWTKATSVAGLVIWSAAYGFASGGILSLQQACAAQLATPSTIGLAIGSVTGSTALSAMANVPISGALAEKYGYLSISIFSGVTVLAGGVLLIAARLVQDRRWRAVV